MSPNSSIMMASPYAEEDDYNIAQVIDETAQELEKEMSCSSNNRGLKTTYLCPVEVDPAILKPFNSPSPKGFMLLNQQAMEV